MPKSVNICLKCVYGVILVSDILVICYYVSLFAYILAYISIKVHRFIIVEN